MPFTVGLTGGIGCGKTAVTTRLAAKGINIVDADQASRRVVEVGKPALKAIEKHYAELGFKVIQPDGGMDRALVRKIIFEDPRERSWLETLLHPLIADDIQRHLKAIESPYGVLVSPLLVEAGQSRFVQRVAVVDVPVETQLTRTMARDGSSEDQVRAIMNAQVSREARLSYADDVIENAGDMESLQRRVDELHAQWLAMAEAHV